MKRLALILLLTGGTAAAQNTPRLPQCNLQNLPGAYAVTYQGWLAVPLPGSAPLQMPGVIMGVLTISPTGAVTGNATVITPSGKSVWEMTPGSFVDIGRDCTGTMTLYSRLKGSSDVPSKEIDRFALVRGSGELVVIMEELDWGAIPMCLGSWKRLTSWPNEAEW